MAIPFEFPGTEQFAPGQRQRRAAAVDGDAIRGAAKELGVLLGVGGAAILLPAAERFSAHLGVTPTTIQKIVTRRSSTTVQGFPGAIGAATGCRVEQHNGLILYLPASAIGAEQREGIEVAAQLDVSDPERLAQVAEVIAANHTPDQVLGLVQALAGQLIAREQM